ncbi:MAG: glucosylceramidase [Lachnospiraceae bacterium]|nr:glucosylceramidase [Lachnospiraceae bacterium]
MQEIRLIVTNDAKKEYWKESVLTKRSIDSEMKLVKVYADEKEQIIDGFGGAFTEASAHSYRKLDQEKRQLFMEQYYGESGLRYHMGRIHINSCDFALGNYTYIEEGDDTLATFDIGHDFEEIIPMIQDALKVCGGKISFMAAPWSPPAFMKANGEMNHGGKLKKEYYQAWAEYFVAFIKAYREAGIQISYVTVQNEPAATQTWDSCVYTAEEERDFAKGYLAPALEKAGLETVGIYVWDHNKETVIERVKPIFEDREARERVVGIAVHWYTGDHFEAIELLRKKYPEKKIFFTEGCVEYSRFADSGEVQKAEMYAHDMLGNLKAGVSGFMDWNLLLDEKGGPNHVGNFCAAPMMLTTGEDGSVDFEKRLSYYYIGHFSRYIQPGAVKIAVTRYTDKVEAAAFLNPDNSRAVVLLNKTEETVDMLLSEAGEGISVSLDSHSIATVVY